jgi:capsular polysaccharide biosynthesis protein
MEKSLENISWIWQIKFLKKASIGTIIMAVLIFIFTLPIFIEPLYEAEEIIYVPLTILSQQLNQQGIGFANDHEIDLYIQILKSNQLKDCLINHFKLANSYKVDTTKTAFKSSIYSTLDSRISIEKTRYGSVSLKVRDADPKIAVEMANGIVKYGEIIKKNLLQSNRQASLDYAQNLFNQKSNEIKGLERTLDSLRPLQNKKADKNGFLMDKTLRIYNFELQEFISRKEDFEQEKNGFDSPLPKTYIVSPAVPSPNPIWPKRWLFMLIGIGSYFFLLIFIEILKRDINAAKYSS